MSKLVLVQFENAVCELDTTLTKVFAQQFPNEAPLPTLDSVLDGTSTSPRKILHKLSNLLNANDFYANLEPVEGAKEILQDIYHYTENFPDIIDMKICITSHPYKGSVRFDSEPLSPSIDVILSTIDQKMRWIDRIYGPKFLQKVIIVDDLRPFDVINCDYYIGVRNVIPNRRQFVPILLSRPYNQHLTSENRLKVWKKWKNPLQLTLTASQVISTDDDSSIDDQIKSFVHGSKDSSDIDRLYMFPGNTLPPHKQCVEFIHASGTEDRNLFVIDTIPGNSDTSTGYIHKCHKGSADELNNGFFTTYHLHEQKNPLPICGKINRCVVLKCCTTLLNLLVKIRRTSVRDSVVKALQGYDFDLRRQCLSCVNFTALQGQLNPDDIKFCAFRLGQTIALMNGIELFTKKDISDHFPDLRPLLYREEQNLETIEKYKNEFLDGMKGVRAIKSKALHMFVSKGEEMGNMFEAQSNGLIIDMREQTMMCVMWPLEFENDFKNDWTMEKESMAEHDGKYVHVFKHDGQVYVTSNSRFDVPKKISKQLARLDLQLDQFYYIFHEGDTKPFAKRSKLTNRLIN
jgi:hypothetical protein